MDVPRRYLGGLQIFALLVVAASAQPADAPVRKIAFTVFATEPGEHVAYVPYPGATPVPLAFFPTARSPHYLHRGPETMHFYDSVTGEPVASVAVPPAIRTALFIFTANDAPESERYRVQVVDEDMARSPPGTLRILNLSGLQLTGTINRRQVALREGLNGPMRVGASASVLLRTPFRDRSYQAYAETIPLGASGRGLLLLLPPYRRGALEVQSRVLLDSPATVPREQRN